MPAGKSRSRRIAVFEINAPDAAIRYELLAQNHALICVRAATLPDGSRTRVILPLTEAESLREFLTADPLLAANRAGALKLVAAAQTKQAVLSDASVQQLSIAGVGDLVRAIERLGRAQDLFDIHVTLRAVARFLGVAGYAGVLGQWSESERTDLHCLAGISPAWCQTFMNRHWYLNSALLDHARRFDRPAFGSEIAANTEGQRTMREETRGFGLRSPQ